MRSPALPPPPDMAAAALDLAERFAWAVFPLHTASPIGCSCSAGAGCKRAGKHPRTEHGLLNATTDGWQIKEWWDRWPEASIGVVTGEVSGFVVLDIDAGKGGEEQLARLVAENAPLPLTPVARTGGGGRHVLFALPAEPLRNSGSKIAQGIDIRGSGGYIVAPPSSHASGGAYAWDPAAHPASTPLAPMPAWLLERARRAPQPVPAAPAPATDHPLHERLKRASAYLARVPGAVAGQSGHQQLWTAALALVRGFDLDQGSALSLLGREYNGRCAPPWSPKELAHKVQGADEAATVPRGYLLNDPRRAWQAPPAPPPADYAPPPSAATAVQAPPPPADDADDTRPSFDRGDQVEIAQALLSTLATAPLTYDEGEFWRYSPDHGAWARLELATVEQTVVGFAGSPVGTGKRPPPLKVGAPTVKGAVALARTDLLSRPSRVTFSAPRRGVAFANGFVTVHGGRIELLPHDPGNLCRYAFPFDYAPAAPAVELAEFFDVVFGDACEDEKAARVALLQEFVGACLIGEATLHQACLVLFGPGGNGKGELLRILRGLFPPGAVVSLPPQHWGARFQATRLVGALANFCDEIPERDITSGDVFKAIITGDPITTERKGQDSFEFAPIAGHLFSANVLPGTVDRSEGFFRRFLVLPFTRDLTRLPSRRPLAGAAVLAACLPGCIAWALQGAARAQVQGYTVSERSRIIVQQWRDDNDPIRLFLHTRLDTNWTGALELYESFGAWARQHGHASMSSTLFGRRLMAIGLYERDEQRSGRFYRRRPAADVGPEGARDGV